MNRIFRVLIVVAFAAGLMAFPLAATAGHKSDPRTKNIHPLGHIVEPASLFTSNPDIHTDIAFWGKHAFQGNWDGFNIRDISAPGNPRQVSRTFCEGNQGDVLVWENILVRSWNTPAGTPGPFGAGLTCDGVPVPAGWEGVHVFDISNSRNPQVVASVQLACGSHTASAVPDRANGRLLVYSSPSSNACPGFDVIQVPLANPAAASYVRFVNADHTCHDVGVILGSAMKAACAGGPGFRVFSIGGPAGGSLDNPMMRYHVEEPGVTIGHSAAWSWDGNVIIFGHEPGGGVAAECEATDDEVKKSIFFYRDDGSSATKLGKWTLPRSQSAIENCSLHNYNVVPLRSGRDVLVMGNYQAGTWVVDFTNVAAGDGTVLREARTVAWSDPPPAAVPPGAFFCSPATGNACDVTGAWSTYWYDGFLYETHIGEGLNVFRLSDRSVAGAMKLRHLNPQTQEFTIG
jgi:hypothetical protein